MEKRGNKASKSTHDARKAWVEPKSNNESKIKRLGWANYKVFDEDINDIDVDGFEDETIGL